MIGGMGMVAQALAAWWWFKVSSYDLGDEIPNLAKELREMGRLNARAAIAQSIASTVRHRALAHRSVCLFRLSADAPLLSLL